MVKKVALVDYDGSLELGGKLNTVLIKDLADKDPVIIFSQREVNTIYTKSASCTDRSCIPMQSAMDELNKLFPKKTILFCSSHDQFYNPHDHTSFAIGQYYEKSLKHYEQICIKHWQLMAEVADDNDMLNWARHELQKAEKDDPGLDQKLENFSELGTKLNNLNRELVAIGAEIQSYKSAQFSQVAEVIAAENFKENGNFYTGEIDGRKINLSKKSLVAEGKVTQFFFLAKELDKKYGNEPLEFTWYEDSQENIIEMQTAMEQEMVSDFKVVQIDSNGKLAPAEKILNKFDYLLADCKAFQDIQWLSSPHELVHSTAFASLENTRELLEDKDEPSNGLVYSTAFTSLADLQDSHADELLNGSADASIINKANELLLAIEQAKTPSALVELLHSDITSKRYPEFTNEIAQLAQQVSDKFAEQKQTEPPNKNLNKEMQKLKREFNQLREQSNKISAESSEETKHELPTMRNR